MNKTKLFLCAIAAAITLLAFVSSSNAQWTWVGSIPANQQGDFPSITVIDGSTVVVAGGPSGQPRAFLSTNGGVNWTTMGTTGLGTAELFCCYATNINNIFVGDGGAPNGAGGNARVFRTTNQGTSWTTAVSSGGTAGFINGIIFSKGNPLQGAIHSDPPIANGTHLMWNSSDGGNTWTPRTGPTTGGFGSVNSTVCIDYQFFGNGTGAGASRYILTTNGGTSFTVQNLNITGTFVSGCGFKFDKLWGVAITSTSLPTVARTVNGGTTWSPVSSGAGPTAGTTVKWIWGTNVVYICAGTGAGGTIKRSADGGVTWATMTTDGITGLNNMEYAIVGSDAHLYAVATDGSVIHYNDAGIVGIDPQNQNVPTDYVLHQNYPNPFNPVTTIKYSIPWASNVTLKIYDLLGNEVLTVVNSYQGAGNYVETVDASSLASGVYFYKLTAGSFTDSKKMTVVK